MIVLILSLVLITGATYSLIPYVDEKIDKYILYLCLLGQLFSGSGILFSPFLREIGHYFFGIMLVIISFISRNNYILLFSIFILLYAMISRKILGGCMYNLMDEYSLVPQIPLNITYDHVYILTIFKILHRLYTLN
tara:strand:- start:45 stop:452 length:408 start_codon:yes stop_codon:yes gene_type:complete